MSYQLSDKTKELLSKRIGIPYEELIKMDDEEIILKQSTTQLKRGKSTGSVSLDMKAIKSLKDDEAR